MVLVDTAVWVDQLGGSDRRLEALLEAGGVFIHPFLVGELACGNLRNRTTRGNGWDGRTSFFQSPHPNPLLEGEGATHSTEETDENPTCCPGWGTLIRR